LVRILRAAVFELCAVGPISYFRTFAKEMRMLSVNCAGLSCALIAQILTSYAEMETLPNAG